MTALEKGKVHCLYLVATPIGNLEDITLRALRILGSVGAIAAEDTRKTRILLKKYDITTPLVSFHEHSNVARMSYLLDLLTRQDIALVSEAGMPGISDPGYELVVKAIENNIRVEPVPGPSAVVAAVAASGLPTDRFCFMGFLPRRKRERLDMLESVAGEKGSLVIFEAPHRLKSSLSDIIQVLGDRRVAAWREITKKYEEVFRGSLSQARSHFENPRGEFTLVIEGNRVVIKDGLPGYEVIDRLKQMKQAGLKASQAACELSSQTGISRRELYRAWLRINKE